MMLATPTLLAPHLYKKAGYAIQTDFTPVATVYDLPIVVVVNPTHIAVALRYAPNETDAPYLVARGREDDAAAIRAEARRLNIPIVKDIALARSLIQFDLGEEIPEELYRAAAAVLKVALDSKPLNREFSHDSAT